MFQFLPSCQELKNSFGVLGENLGLAGVVLLLDRRDRRDSCSFVMQVNKFTLRSRATYSEGGTHEEMLCPQSKAKVGNKK